jgi:hypothetical protein
MSAAAAADSSRAYATLCDAGYVAIVNTTTSSVASGQNNQQDLFDTDLVTPFGAGPAGPSGLPATQNPVFLLMGQ